MASPEAQKDRPAAARAAECKAERLRQRAWNRNHRTTSPRDVAAVEVEQPINPTKNRGPLHSAPPLKDLFEAFASPCFVAGAWGLYCVVEHEIVLSYQ